MDEYDIKLKYDYIESLYAYDKRYSSKFNNNLKSEMILVPPLKINSTLVDVLNYFQNSSYDFVPIIDSNFVPLGVILEKDLREYIYSPFGRELLTSKLHNISLNQFIRKTPTIDIRSKVEDALSLIVQYSSEGIFVTNDMSYLGFITNSAILKILNDLRLKQAFETNPLTGLPGNTQISEIINSSLNDNERYNYFVYFDFDNFKPFNDRFGFRIGDRAILAFTNVLKKIKTDDNIFIGHVGGDDFFMSVKTEESNPYLIISLFEKIKKEFEEFATSFYSLDEIVNRSYKSINRDGNEKIFPLLSVSAAILEVPIGVCNISEIELSKVIADLKKIAKNSLAKYSITTLFPK